MKYATMCYVRISFYSSSIFQQYFNVSIDLVKFFLRSVRRFFETNASISFTESVYCIIEKYDRSTSKQPNVVYNVQKWLIFNVFYHNYYFVRSDVPRRDDCGLTCITITYVKPRDFKSLDKQCLIKQ